MRWQLVVRPSLQIQGHATVLAAVGFGSTTDAVSKFHVAHATPPSLPPAPSVQHVAPAATEPSPHPGPTVPQPTTLALPTARAAATSSAPNEYAAKLRSRMEQAILLADTGTQLRLLARKIGTNGSRCLIPKLRAGYWTRLLAVTACRTPPATRCYLPL